MGLQFIQIFVCKKFNKTRTTCLFNFFVSNEEKEKWKINAFSQFIGLMLLSMVFFLNNCDNFKKCNTSKRNFVGVKNRNQSVLKREIKNVKKIVFVCHREKRRNRSIKKKLRESHTVGYQSRQNSHKTV